MSRDIEAYSERYPIRSHRTVAELEDVAPMPIAIAMTLPCPPSANELFANRIGGGGRVKTKVYKAWLEDAGWHVKRAWSGLGKPKWADAQPMQLTIVAGIGRHRDLTNCCKAVEDLLVAALPVPDDRWNDCVILHRGPHIDGLVHVRLEPLILV